MWFSKLAHIILYSRRSATAHSIMTESKKKAAPTHPSCIDMIVAAVTNLKDKKGSSAQAIKKYIAANFNTDVDKLAPHIKRAFVSGVTSGKLVQTKGKGASGSFKLNAKAVDDKEKKAKEAAKKKAKKEKDAEKIKANKEKLAAKKQALKEKSAAKKKSTVATKKKPTTKKLATKKPTKAAEKTKKKAAPKKTVKKTAKKTPTKSAKPSKKVADKKKKKPAKKAAASTKTK